MDRTLSLLIASWRRAYCQTSSAWRVRERTAVWRRVFRRSRRSPGLPFRRGATLDITKSSIFLVPDRRSYLPKLCSAEISPPARSLNIGKYRIPVGKPRIQFERRSRSFWKILGDHGVFSTVLRVPTSFPPEKFNGLLLSAMSVPDLKGTLGNFQLLHQRSERERQPHRRDTDSGQSPGGTGLLLCARSRKTRCGRTRWK